MKTKTLWITGLIATFGALITGVGEWLMLYSPDMGYGAAAGHQNFLHPTPQQLELGYYLGVLGAPIYLLGYWHISQMLKLTVKWQWVMMGLATVGFVVGNVWLGTNAYIGILVQTLSFAPEASQGLVQSLLLFIDGLSEPLLQVVRVVVLSLSLIMAWFIFKGKTHYPRWCVAVVPFALILYIFAWFCLHPNSANYVLPATLNVSHGIWFALSTYFAYRKG